MRPVRLAAVPAALAVVLAAAGCGGSGGVTLRSAEAAFSLAHIPFQSEWRPSSKSPYLTQPAYLKSYAPAMLPASLRPHLRAAAQWQSARTFKVRLVLVFDSSSEANHFAAWDRKGVQQGTIKQGSNVVLVARNAVYYGENVAAAGQAMARLRG